jgi:ferredoxin
MIAPEVFVLNDVDGTASARFEDVPAEQKDSANEAARSCPEQAIRVTAVAVSQPRDDRAGQIAT